MDCFPVPASGFTLKSATTKKTKTTSNQAGFHSFFWNYLFFGKKTLYLHAFSEGILEKTLLQN